MVGLVIYHVGYSLVTPRERGIASHIPSVAESDTAYSHLFPDPLLNLFFLCVYACALLYPNLLIL